MRWADKTGTIVQRENSREREQPDYLTEAPDAGTPVPMRGSKRHRGCRHLALASSLPMRALRRHACPQTLLRMTMDKLRNDVGIGSLGHRELIMDEIDDMKQRQRE